MIPFRPLSDDAAELACSPLLRATLLTITYIEDNGPIPLTAGKALKRTFVHWAAEAFDWPDHTAKDLYAVNKVLNESDFLPLMALHDLLLSAKLARHYKGAMHLTNIARELKAKPAALWALLATHLLCAIDHGRYSPMDDPPMGNWTIFLNVINIEAQDPITGDRLGSHLFGEAKAGDWRGDFQQAASLYVWVLRPLCWAGLLTEHRIGNSLAKGLLYAKTGLWPAALALETDIYLQPVTRH